MHKYYCGGCLTSFFLEDLIFPVHCPECDTSEGVWHKGKVLPRRFEVTYTWCVESYATWMAQDKARKRGFADYDACSVIAIDTKGNTNAVGGD
jgi:hypothetical protein